MLIHYITQKLNNETERNEFVSIDTHTLLQVIILKWIILLRKEVLASTF